MNIATPYNGYYVGNLIQLWLSTIPKGDVNNHTPRHLQLHDRD